MAEQIDHLPEHPRLAPRALSTEPIEELANDPFEPRRGRPVALHDRRERGLGVRNREQRAESPRALDRSLSFSRSKGRLLG
jgi:hypothetical protein